MLETLRKEQPVAFRMMKNALEHKLVHAYLFHGPRGTHKKEAAVLFAQSLLCEHKVDGFACGSCDTCVRIEKNVFADMIMLDGEKASIKREDIDYIQKEFSLTALEQYGKKVYILNNCENSTVAAMNRLLKFLEEPQEDVIAILCTDQVERVLPTIVSRCQLVPFRLADSQYKEHEAIEQGMSILDAHLTSTMVSTVAGMLDLADEEDYQTARGLWMEFIGKCYDDVRDGILFLMTEGFSPKKLNNKEVLAYFLNVGILFAEDCLYKKEIENEDWMKLLQDFPKLKISANALLSILLNVKDRSLRNANVLLTVDQMGYLLVKEVS